MMKQKYTALAMTGIALSFIFSACSSTAAVVTPTPLIATAVKKSASTVAEASVVPIQSANLNFATTGIVEEIIKPEGSSVRKDDPIARLQGQERLEAGLTNAKLALASAQQSLSNFMDNAQVNKSAIELKMANADKALKDAKKDLKNATYKRGTQEQVDEARARYLVAQDDFDTLNDTYSNMAGYDDTNLLKAKVLYKLSMLRTTRDHALADLNYLLQKPDSYDLAIAQSKADVAQANLDAAKTELAKLNSDGTDPDDLAVVQANRDNAKAQEAAAQSALDDLTLKAPFDGTVIAVNLKVGETATGISSAQPQVVMANSSDWQIETSDLTELNINAIQEGDPVKVTFDAIPDLELTGKVLRIQSLGTNKQGDITYKVTVSLDQQDPRLRWNMTALVAFDNKP
jgi:HlyD family secretion protein